MAYPMDDYIIETLFMDLGYSDPKDDGEEGGGPMIIAMQLSHYQLLATFFGIIGMLKISHSAFREYKNRFCTKHPKSTTNLSQTEGDVTRDRVLSEDMGQKRNWRPFQHFFRRRNTGRPSTTPHEITERAEADSLVNPNAMGDMTVKARKDAPRDILDRYSSSLSSNSSGVVEMSGDHGRHTLVGFAVRGDKGVGPAHGKKSNEQGFQIADHKRNHGAPNDEQKPEQSPIYIDKFNDVTCLKADQNKSTRLRASRKKTDNLAEVIRKLSRKLNQNTLIEGRSLSSISGSNATLFLTRTNRVPEKKKSAMIYKPADISAIEESRNDYVDNDDDKFDRVEYILPSDISPPRQGKQTNSPQVTRAMTKLIPYGYEVGASDVPGGAQYESSFSEVYLMSETFRSHVQSKTTDSLVPSACVESFDPTKERLHGSEQRAQVVVGERCAIHNESDMLSSCKSSHFDYRTEQTRSNSSLSSAMSNSPLPRYIQDGFGRVYQADLFRLTNTTKSNEENHCVISQQTPGHFDDSCNIRSTKFTWHQRRARVPLKRMAETNETRTTKIPFLVQKGENKNEDIVDKIDSKKLIQTSLAARQDKKASQGSGTYSLIDNVANPWAGHQHSPEKPEPTTNDITKEGKNPAESKNKMDQTTYRNARSVRIHPKPSSKRKQINPTTTQKEQTTRHLPFGPRPTTVQAASRKIPVPLSKPAISSQTIDGVNKPKHGREMNSSSRKNVEAHNATENVKNKTDHFQDVDNVSPNLYFQANSHLSPTSAVLKPSSSATNKSMNLSEVITYEEYYAHTLTPWLMSQKNHDGHLSRVNQSNTKQWTEERIQSPMLIKTVAKEGQPTLLYDKCDARQETRDKKHEPEVIFNGMNKSRVFIDSKSLYPVCDKQTDVLAYKNGKVISKQKMNKRAFHFPPLGGKEILNKDKERRKQVGGHQQPLLHQQMQTDNKRIKRRHCDHKARRHLDALSLSTGVGPLGMQSRRPSPEVIKTTDRVEGQPQENEQVKEPFGLEFQYQAQIMGPSSGGKMFESCDKEMPSSKVLRNAKCCRLAKEKPDNTSCITKKALQHFPSTRSTLARQGSADSTDRKQYKLVTNSARTKNVLGNAPKPDFSPVIESIRKSIIGDHSSFLNNGNVLKPCSLETQRCLKNTYKINPTMGSYQESVNIGSVFNYNAASSQDYLDQLDLIEQLDENTYSHKQNNEAMTRKSLPGPVKEKASSVLQCQELLTGCNNLSSILYDLASIENLEPEEAEQFYLPQQQPSLIETTSEDPSGGCKTYKHPTKQCQQVPRHGHDETGNATDTYATQPLHSNHLKISLSHRSPKTSKTGKCLGQFCTETNRSNQMNYLTSRANEKMYEHRDISPHGSPRPDQAITRIITPQTRRGLFHVGCVSPLKTFRRNHQNVHKSISSSDRDLILKDVDTNQRQQSIKSPYSTTAFHTPNFYGVFSVEDTLEEWARSNIPFDGYTPLGNESFDQTERASGCTCNSKTDNSLVDKNSAQMTQTPSQIEEIYFLNNTQERSLFDMCRAEENPMLMSGEESDIQRQHCLKCKSQDESNERDLNSKKQTSTCSNITISWIADHEMSNGPRMAQRYGNKTPNLSCRQHDHQTMDIDPDIPSLKSIQDLCSSTEADRETDSLNQQPHTMGAETFNQRWFASTNLPKEAMKNNNNIPTSLTFQTTRIDNVVKNHQTRASIFDLDSHSSSVKSGSMDNTSNDVSSGEFGSHLSEAETDSLRARSNSSQAGDINDQPVSKKYILDWYKPSYHTSVPSQITSDEAGGHEMMHERQDVDGLKSASVDDASTQSNLGVSTCPTECDDGDDNDTDDLEDCYCPNYTDYCRLQDHLVTNVINTKSSSIQNMVGPRDNLNRSINNRRDVKYRSDDDADDDDYCHCNDMTPGSGSLADVQTGSSMTSCKSKGEDSIWNTIPRSCSEDPHAYYYSSSDENARQKVKWTQTKPTSGISSF